MCKSWCSVTIEMREKKGERSVKKSQELMWQLKWQKRGENKAVFWGKFFDKRDTFKNSKKSIKLGNFFIHKNLSMDREKKMNRHTLYSLTENWIGGNWKLSRKSAWKEILMKEEICWQHAFLTFPLEYRKRHTKIIHLDTDW